MNSMNHKPLNQYDNLNYQNPRRNHVNDLIDAYNKLEKDYEGHTESKPSHDVEALRKKYEKDPESLSGIQLLMLGMHELDEKQKVKAKVKQKSVNDYTGYYNEAEKERQEEISTQSEQFLRLSEGIEELQKAFQSLNGGVDE